MAITLALGKPADIYLIDEPSAYLDSEQRLVAAKVRWVVYRVRPACGLITLELEYALPMMSVSSQVKCVNNVSSIYRLIGGNFTHSLSLSLAAH